MNEQLIEKLEDKMNLIKKLEGQLNRWVPEPGSFFLGGGVSNPLCFSSSLALHFFWIFFFCVHHPANRDDRHVLAHAMASDFSVARQFLSKRIIGFSLGINHHIWTLLGLHAMYAPAYIHWWPVWVPTICSDLYFQYK
jgi:hypothetical protein